MAETIRNALRRASEVLAAKSDSPRLDAEILLAHLLGTSRSEMILRHLDAPSPAGFDALLARRAMQEPIAYITGYQEFWGLELQASPAVLIPRPDSETLIEAALAYFKDRTPALRIADLGTGSGALLIAALSEFKAAHGLALDASAAALEVARANLAAHRLSKRSQLAQLDWQIANWPAALPAPFAGQPFDLILCNPPYVERDAPLAANVRDYEPHRALFSGDDGLDDYRILVPQIPELLGDDGAAIFELGAGQYDPVAEIARLSGLDIDHRCDLAGHIRALILRKDS